MVLGFYGFDTLSLYFFIMFFLRLLYFHNAFVAFCSRIG